MNSKIEWTGETWNPTTGCTKVSSGCKHCYAEVMALRLQAMGTKGYEKGFNLALHEYRLQIPLLRKKPTTYFVNSMSDLFHEDISYNFIDNVFDIMRQSSHHTYQVLTKRSSRMADYFSKREVPNNAWLGVTVENRKLINRIEHLRKIQAPVSFISAEPLLEDLGKLDLKGIDWVIVGGESGARARAMSEDWALNIKDLCDKAGVQFFFKQWGAYGSDGVKRSKKENGRTLKRRIYDAMPVSL